MKTDRRLELHEKLCDILGSRNVYFQPPESIRMKYPAIIYSRSNINAIFANNKPYQGKRQYEVIIIDEDPDSEIIDKMYDLESVKFSRHYVSDNLNHDVFVIYF